MRSQSNRGRSAFNLAALAYVKRKLMSRFVVIIRYSYTNEWQLNELEKTVEIAFVMHAVFYIARFMVRLIQNGGILYVVYE